MNCLEVECDEDCLKGYDCEFADSYVPRQIEGKAKDLSPDFFANVRKAPGVQQDKIKMLYEFRNLEHNYITGYFYFIALSYSEALDLAKQYQTKFNEGKNFNYIIDLHYKDSYDINHIGYVSIGRST